MSRRGEWRAARVAGEGCCTFPRAGEAVMRGVAEFLASVSRENPDDGVRGSPPGDYRVGQVASSLCRGEHHSRGGTGRLAALFSSLEPQIQPVYVPVPKVSHWAFFPNSWLKPLTYETGFLPTA